jgi:hypothetical protein
MLTFGTGSFPAPPRWMITCRSCDLSSAHRMENVMSNTTSRSRVRWHATATYRSNEGHVVVPMMLEEVGDLHDWIEKGPHWDTIVKIEIHRVNHIDSPTLTVEQQAKM